MTFPLKIEYSIHHVFQHTWSCQLSLLGHMPNNKCGNVIGFGNLHEFSSDFTNLRYRTLNARNLWTHDGLNRVDNEEIGFYGLYLAANGLHISLSIKIKFVINIT